MIKPEDKLSKLMNDPHYLEAITWAFESVIEDNRPEIEANNSNELLGERYRAYMIAQYIVVQCIKKIESYKDIQTNNNDFDKSK